MSSLSELIERVEKSSGQDRELDVAIYRAEFPFPCVKLSAEAQKKIDQEKAPSYTASIDAALTLLPDGYDSIVRDVNGHYGGTPYACVGDTTQQFAATAVLALTAACLKARLALDSTQDTEARHD